MKIHSLIMALMILGVTGCTNQALYDSVRNHQRTECLKAPPPSDTECIERNNKSYGEYEQERKELLKEVEDR